jgi:hypothetical protein
MDADVGFCLQPKYTAKAEDKISEARTKPAQGALDEEASVNRYNAMKAAAAAAVNRCAGVNAQLRLNFAANLSGRVVRHIVLDAGCNVTLLLCRVSGAISDTQQAVQDKTKKALDQGVKVQLQSSQHVPLWQCLLSEPATSERLCP